MAVRSHVLTARVRADPPVRQKYVPLRSPFTLLAYALALLALLVLVQNALQWAQRRLDDWRYGFPRTTSLDAFVGHGEEQGLPSHLRAVNLHGQVVVVEFPGGDVARTTVLAGPQLVGGDATYVAPKLAVRDLNDDGHVDLLLTLKGEMVVYLNQDGAFQPPSPEALAALRRGAQ
jgi:hypothetical protein